MTKNAIETVNVPENAAVLATPWREKTSFQKDAEVSGVSSTQVTEFHVISWGFDPGSLRNLISEFYKWETADQIAELFRAEGIKGDRNVLESCPIAGYATKCSGIDVEVNEYGISFSGGKFNFPATPAMKDFILRFDQGFYPELVR